MISNLLIRVKAVELLLWEVRVHTQIRAHELCMSWPSCLVFCAALSCCEASVILYGTVQGCVSGADCGTV